MRKTRIFIYSILVCLLYNETIFSIEQPNKLGISIGNLWLGAKGNIFSQIISTEVRYYGFDPEVKTLSARTHCNFYRSRKVNTFVGLEYGQIYFNMEGISGDGSLIMPFIGTELLIIHRISLSIDIGYANITLKSKGFSVSGPEWLCNIGVIFYFL